MPFSEKSISDIKMTNMVCLIPQVRITYPSCILQNSSHSLTFGISTHALNK